MKPIIIIADSDRKFTAEELKRYVEDAYAQGYKDGTVYTRTRPIPSLVQLSREPPRPLIPAHPLLSHSEGGYIMKAMLSQPMAGKTDEEIIATREKAIKTLEGKGYEVINTFFTDEWYSREKMTERGVVQIPLCFLAKSLENMSLCHAAYFAKGWENARGCKIEHDAAVAYGLTIIYEEI